MLDGGLGMQIAAVLGAVAFAAVVYALLYPWVADDRQKDKRVQSVTENRARKVSSRTEAETAANRRKAVTETLKDLETRQKTKEKLTLRLRLERAGLDATPRSFWIASALLGLVSGAAAYMLLPENDFTILLVLIVAFVATLGVPRWVLSKMIKRRQYAFLRELANSVDVIVRGVKSGLPLNECLGVIARESPEPIAGEFRDVVDQQRVGVSLSEALERLSTRMPLAEVRFLAIVIGIQQQAGGNLSEALANLSGVLRDRFRLQMKVKALSAEAKASAMVLASLPPTVMVMVYGASPDYIMPLFVTLTGKFMIGFGLCWMGMGVLVMRKMINFKY